LAFSKKIEISFENFQEMLNGSKFGKRRLLGISSTLFSDLENSKKKFRKS
jgi:hypothetical protein